MEHAMEWSDDEVTIIQVRDELLRACGEPPALPFPLVRRKLSDERGVVFALTAAMRLFS